MSRKAEKDENRVRIAFMLDKRTDPELAHIVDMNGFGERPRELLRLATLGHRVEQMMFKALGSPSVSAGLMDLNRIFEAQAAGMTMQMVSPAPQEAGKSRKATPKTAFEPVQEAAKPAEEAPDAKAQDSAQQSKAAAQVSAPASNAFVAQEEPLAPVVEPSSPAKEQGSVAAAKPASASTPPSSGTPAKVSSVSSFLA